jgi:hypothetical protein
VAESNSEKLTKNVCASNGKKNLNKNIESGETLLSSSLIGLGYNLITNCKISKCYGFSAL